jgi:hypothetical protein
MNNFNQPKFPKPKPILKLKSPNQEIKKVNDEEEKNLTKSFITHREGSEIIVAFPVSEDEYFDKYSLPLVQKLTEYRMYNTPEIVAKLKTMDYSEGGFLLFDTSKEPEIRSNGMRELFEFHNSEQAIKLMQYLDDNQYDLEGFLGGWAKNQAIFFGSSNYDYPVNSNF